MIQYQLTWIRTDSVDEYSPITQVYGICFSSDDKILIARSSESAGWQIPGGTPEEGESIEQTLKRELLEEADITVKDIKILGVQKVDVPRSPEKTHYQVRCVCFIEELLPQTPDPANGRTWERKLVDATKVTDYVKWGKTGNAMFADAIEKIKG